MTERETPAAAAQPAGRFWLLLIALVVLLIGYPYFDDTRTGAFLGGVTSLLALTGGVYAVRTHRWTFRAGLTLALAAAAADARAFLAGVRGDFVVEATSPPSRRSPSSSRSSRRAGSPPTRCAARSASTCSWA